MPRTRRFEGIESRAEAYREKPVRDFWIRAAGRTGRQDTNGDDVVCNGSRYSTSLCLYRGVERSRGLHTIGCSVWVHYYSLRIYDNSKTDRRYRVHRGWNLDHSLAVMRVGRCVCGDAPRMACRIVSNRESKTRLMCRGTIDMRATKHRAAVDFQMIGRTIRLQRKHESTFRP
jgi:hypothetical protein